MSYCSAYPQKRLLLTLSRTELSMQSPATTTSLSCICKFFCRNPPHFSTHQKSPCTNFCKNASCNASSSNSTFWTYLSWFYHDTKVLNLRQVINFMASCHIWQLSYSATSNPCNFNLSFFHHYLVPGSYVSGQRDNRHLMIYLLNISRLEHQILIVKDPVQTQRYSVIVNGFKFRIMWQ